MAAQLASSWHLEHLLKWLHMFDLQNHLPSSDSLSDGVLVSKVLNQIDSQWFHEEWLLKIKNNIGSNKILKVSNWKKVLERLVDYYEVHLDQRLSGFAMPDASKIVESDDEGELCRLLQLVLGCAVRCERQEEFIQAILQMEEDVQRGIMAAIQGLPGIELAGGSLADMAGRSPSQTAAMGYHNLISQLEAANDEKDLLVKKHQQQNRQISELQEEIQHLHNEIEALRSGTGPMESLDKSDVGQPTALMLKREIQRLTEELLRSDYARDDYRNRCDVLEQELDKMRMRQDELQGAAEQTRSLKDEVDILRERSAKLENAQSTIDSMRRKVEEGTELRRQLRKLEEKNSQYIQQNLELEEELKKLGPWKSQLEAQKKQITEVQSELEEERRRADKFELQFKNMLERNEALTQEKERLLAERGKLVERNEELQYAQLNNGAMMMDGSPTTDVDTLDMIPPEIREKMLRLQHENRLLKEKKDAEAEVLQTDNAGLSERIAQLEAENRKSTKRVLELEIQLENSRVGSPVSSANADSNQASDSLVNKDVAALKIRIKSMEREMQQKKLEAERMEIKLTEQMDRAKGSQEQLRRKDSEMQAMEERYKKYIEKAKMVLKTLDPKSNPGLGASSPEIAALQAQLKEKDRLIERLEVETERHKVLREAEDQLVTTAFYNLGMQLQRQAMEQRLGSGQTGQAAMATVSPPTAPAQSFLSRQRQASARGRTSSINPQGETFN